MLFKKMLPQFQLNCINAQGDCPIRLKEAMGLSVHLTSHEQFNLNQLINLACYSRLGNLMDESNTDFFLLNIVEILSDYFQISKNFPACLQVISQENFRLSTEQSNSLRKRAMSARRRPSLTTFEE